MPTTANDDGAPLPTLTPEIVADDDKLWEALAVRPAALPPPNLYPHWMFPNARRHACCVRRDDDEYGSKSAAVAEGAGIELVKIPPRSPNLNPICERFLESVRHECFDHVIVFDEQHLRQVVKEYVSYFNASRPHQGIAQRIPGEGHCDLPLNSHGRVVAMPILGGLHHDYRWAA